MFSLDSTARLAALRHKQALNKGCISWYGHAYIKLENSLKCARGCGSVLPIRNRTTTCTSWYGHNYKQDKQCMWCTVCGDTIIKAKGL